MRSPQYARGHQYGESIYKPVEQEGIQKRARPIREPPEGKAPEDRGERLD